MKKISLITLSSTLLSFASSFTMEQNFVGKKTESMTFLEKALEKNEQLKKQGMKAPRKIWLYGKAGVGKSTFIKELARKRKLRVIDAHPSSFACRSKPEIFSPRSFKKFIDQIRMNSGEKEALFSFSCLDIIPMTFLQLYLFPILQKKMEQLNQEGYTLTFIAETREQQSELSFFDFTLEVPDPDKKARTELIKHYLSKISYPQKVEYAQIAEKTEGFSGAQLEQMINLCTAQAYLDEAKEITTEHLIKHIEKSKPKKAALLYPSMYV